MIAFVDSPPTIEPHGDGFRVTVKSGESETAFLLTLHALSGLAGMSRARVSEAQAKAALFEPTPFQLQLREARPNSKRRAVKRKD